MDGWVPRASDGDRFSTDRRGPGLTRKGRLFAPVLLIGLLGGCVSAHPVSQAGDQQSVEHWRSVVTADQRKLQAAEAAVGSCTGTPPHAVCGTPTVAENEAVTAAQKAVDEAQFHLQVARDQHDRTKNRG